MHVKPAGVPLTALKCHLQKKERERAFEIKQTQNEKKREQKNISGDI